jgi:hypothetical protein
LNAGFRIQGAYINEFAEFVKIICVIKNKGVKWNEFADRNKDIGYIPNYGRALLYNGIS